MSPRSRKLIRLGVVAAIAGALLAQLDLRQVWAAFDRRMLLAALVFQLPMALAFLAYAKRHAILARAPPVPLRPALEAVMLSSTLNLVVPGRLSELVKATYLRSSQGVPIGQSLTAIVVQKLMDMVAVGAIAVAAIAGSLMHGLGWFAAVPLLALAALIMLRPIAALLGRRLARLGHPLARFVRDQCAHVAAVLDQRTLFRATLLTAASWTAHLLAIWLFFRLQPGLPGTLADVALVFSAIMFIGALPLLPAGVGTFEAAVVFVLHSRGVEVGQALAIGLHCAEVALAAAVGPFLLARRSTGLGTLMAEAMQLLRAKDMHTTAVAAPLAGASPEPKRSGQAP